jgi:hypothetical protein
MFICGFLVWDIHLFATAPTYGAQPNCNGSVIYVVLGINVPATSPIFRWILVATLSILLLGSVLSMIFFPCIGGDADSDNGTDDGGNEIAPWFYLVGHLAGSSYIIAMIELMIKRNRVDRTEDAWSFGQVLAMVMLVGPLIELVAFLLERKEDTGHGSRNA